METFDQTQLQQFEINIGPIDTSMPFISNPWVRTAVEKIATNISLLPLFIGNKKSAKGGNNKLALVPLDTEIITDSKWNDLLKRPHPLLTTSDFLSLLITYALIPPGDAFVLCLNKNGKPISSPSEIPTTMFPVHGKLVTERVKNQQDGLQYFEGWEYNGTLYTDYQLRQFRLTINPHKPLRGIDPVTSALTYLKTDQLTSEFNEKFFQNAAIPSGILYSPQKLNDPAAEQLEKRWQSRFGGSENMGKTPVLSGGLQWVQTQSNNKDSQQIELKSLSREAIASVYQVPLSEMGITDKVNNGTAVSLNSSFWFTRLIPIKKKIEEWFEVKFFFNSSEYAFLDLTNIEALIPALVDKLKAGRQYWEMGYPINVINERLELGMGEVKFGDTQFAAPGFVPIDLLTKQMEAGIKAAKADNKVSSGPENEVSNNNKTTATSNTDKSKRSLSKNDAFELSKLIYQLRTAVLSEKLNKIQNLSTKFNVLGLTSLFDEIINNMPKQNIREYFNEISRLIKQDLINKD